MNMHGLEVRHRFSWFVGAVPLLIALSAGCSTSPEEKAWELATEGTGSVKLLDQYLDQFPDGIHKDTAVSRLRQFGIRDVTARSGWKWTTKGPGYTPCT
jgi:hypothetical protein